MPDLPTALQQILRHDEPLDPDLPLGAGGLGLDSIRMVEVLLACEEQFGVALAAELLDGKPLTVGRLVDRIRGLA
jgi:acyl carrier protein